MVVAKGACIQVEAAEDPECGESGRRRGDQRADAESCENGVTEAAGRAPETERHAAPAAPRGTDRQDHQVVGPGRERDQYGGREKASELFRRKQLHFEIVPPGQLRG